MPVTAGPNIVEDGLVFYVDAANKVSWTGPDSSTVNDLIGTNNGTISADTSGSYGQFNSFDFDAVDDIIDFGTLSEINGLANFSFNVWLTTPTQNAGDSIAFGNRDSSNSYRGIALSIPPNTSTTSIYFYFTSNAGSGQSWVEIPVAYYTANAWNNIAVTYDGSTLTAIVNNGTPLTDSQSSKLLHSTTNFRVGKDGWTNSKLYKGNIGPLQIYNRALSAAEVTQNYNALKSRFGL